MAKKESRTLYRFTYDCGRMGEVEGLFTAMPSEVKAALGREVYFGEILGKHSEVSFTLEKRHFKVLTDDAAFVAKFDGFDCASGHNPLLYLEDHEDDE